MASQTSGDNLVAVPGYSRRFGYDVFYFVLGMNRSFQGHGPVLTDDLDVVGVCGERFVGHERPPDLGRESAIGCVHFLLTGGGLSGILVALIHLCVIGLDLAIG